MLLTTQTAVTNFVSQVKPQLNEFFGCRLRYPKIVLLTSAKRYTRAFTNSTRKTIHPFDAVAQFETTSAFYDQERNKIYLPAFTRTGFTAFEAVDKLSVETQALVHELIHAFQFRCGGYSFSDFFDESTAELCAYIFAGSIKSNDGSGYFEWVSYLYTLLESTGLSQDAIVQWCKEYVVSGSRKKGTLIRTAITAYIDKHGIQRRWRTIHNALENTTHDQVTTRQRHSAERIVHSLPKFSRIDREYVQDCLYELHEKYRIV